VCVHKIGGGKGVHIRTFIPSNLSVFQKPHCSNLTPTSSRVYTAVTRLGFFQTQLCVGSDTAVCRFRHGRVSVQTWPCVGSDTAVCRFRHSRVSVQTQLCVGSDTAVCRFRHSRVSVQTHGMFPCDSYFCQTASFADLDVSFDNDRKGGGGNTGRRGR